MRALRWLGDYWWIPALILVGVGLSILGHRAVSLAFGSGFQKKLDLELGVIGARREAREIKISQGTVAAKKHVNEKYVETRKRLDAEAKLKVRRLEDDPVALAAYLDRLAERG